MDGRRPLAAPSSGDRAGGVRSSGHTGRRVMEIADKVFVVTGAGNGIGREVARELIRRGARVAAVDLREAGLAETAALAAAPEGRLSTHVLNVADRPGAEALPEQIVAAHGAVDGLLNIAGIIHRFVPL